MILIILMEDINKSEGVIYLKSKKALSFMEEIMLRSGTWT